MKVAAERDELSRGRAGAESASAAILGDQNGYPPRAQRKKKPQLDWGFSNGHPIATARKDYMAFLSSFFSSLSAFFFLAFFSFLAGASAAGASSALAMVQEVGTRTARARKMARVRFMGFSLLR